MEGQNRIIEEAIQKKPNAIVLAPSAYEETVPYIRESALCRLSFLRKGDIWYFTVAEKKFKISLYLKPNTTNTLKRRVPFSERIRERCHVESTSVSQGTCAESIFTAQTGKTTSEWPQSGPVTPLSSFEWS